MRLDPPTALAYYHAMALGVGSSGWSLLSLVGAGTAMAAAPQPRTMPVQCSATGTKFFVPAMTATDVCARFVQAYAIATRAPATLSVALPSSGGLVVELRFLPQGIASAKATQLCDGRPQPLPLFELAVSDRRFAADDINRLAADVARGITMRAAIAGKR